MDKEGNRDVVKRLNNLGMLEKLADIYEREDFNFRQLVDVAHTDNFKENLGNPDITHAENKKMNNMKRSKADALRTVFNKLKKKTNLFF